MEIINLDMTPSTVTPNAHAGQYDAARTVRFMLKNGGVPFTLAGTETITAEITRSDNTEVTVNVANTSSNYVDVVFDDTVCTVKGLYACELRIVDGGVDIGSKNFALLVQRDPYDGKNVRVVTVGPADICTFETTLAEPLQSVLVNVLATGGNGTPDNPNPINGYTEANITRCGVNLFSLEKFLTDNGVSYTKDGEWCVFTPTTPLYMLHYKLPVSTSKSLLLLIDGSTTATNFRVRIYDNNDTYVASTPSGNPTSSTLDNKTIGYIGFDWSTVGTVKCKVCVIDGITAPTAYIPYTGNTYTIAFGQTVYGGVLDVTRGKLHVTYGYVKLGDLSYTKLVTTPSIFYASVSGMKYPTTDEERIIGFICTDYPASLVASIDSNMSNKTCLRRNGNIYIRNTDYENDTVDTFKATLKNAYLAYELATPFDIDLTPEVISAIVGTNNVFAGCGQTAVKYLKAGA